MKHPGEARSARTERTTLRRVQSNPVLVRLFAPGSLVQTRKFFPRLVPLRILDLGCGGNAVHHFKSAFPNCHYVGVDLALPSGGDDYARGMDEFVQADLDRSELAQFPRESFDLIVLAHVVEHLRRGLGIIERVAPLLRPNGIIYLGYPTEQSRSFPSRRQTLNFYDDITHVTVVRHNSAIEALENCGLRVETSGRIRRPLFVLAMPVRVALSPFTGGITGPMLWDMYGFEEWIVGRKPSIRAKTSEAAEAR